MTVIVGILSGWLLIVNRDNKFTYQLIIMADIIPIIKRTGKMRPRLPFN